HAWHSPQRPTHLIVVHPHSEHLNDAEDLLRVEVLAIAQCYRAMRTFLLRTAWAVRRWPLDARGRLLPAGPPPWGAATGPGLRPAALQRPKRADPAERRHLRAAAARTSRICVGQPRLSRAPSAPRC